CLRGASAVAKTLEQRPSDDVRVFAVWEPIIATDWGRPTTVILGRLPDRRAAQFWDPDHLLARRLSGDAREPQPPPDCGPSDGVLWALAAVYPPGAVWNERIPPAVFFNGPIVRVMDDLAAVLGRAAGGSVRAAP